jgi:hypothetical protein
VSSGIRAGSSHHRKPTGRKAVFARNSSAERRSFQSKNKFLRPEEY